MIFEDMTNEELWELHDYYKREQAIAQIRVDQMEESRHNIFMLLYDRALKKGRVPFRVVQQ